jgi:XTP/dITP diphosphohydrolase
MKLVLASHNAHKVAELRPQLARLGLDLVGMDAFPQVPEPPEDEATFEGNALSKARYVHAATGLPALADDSGLEVDALGGAPGVHSKRYSPEGTAEANNARLLQALEGCADRRARFRTVLALVWTGGEATVGGACEGAIATAPRGAHGFGYDPLFLPDATPGRTMAELLPAEKAAIGHRGAAVRALPSILGRLQGTAATKTT